MAHTGDCASSRTVAGVLLIHGAWHGPGAGTASPAASPSTATTPAPRGCAVTTVPPEGRRCLATTNGEDAHADGRALLLRLSAWHLWLEHDGERCG